MRFTFIGVCHLFPFRQIEERLSSYVEKYDIVLIEDESMAIPRKIFDAIVNH